MSEHQDVLSNSVSDLSLQDRLYKLSRELAPLLKSTRRHFHMNPELGFLEYQSSEYIRGMLENHGLKAAGPLATTGLYVDIEGSHPGPAVGYRADMDALPIQDAKQVPYASQVPGVAHLCGHDAHTTVAIGVAVVLNQLRDLLHGKVRVFFQPNEEGTPSGSIPMIRDGVLQGLEAAYCIHVDPTLEVGRYGLIVGPVTAAADRFRFSIKSESTGHSARPHQATDTIWIANQLLSLLYQYVGRVTDTRNAAVLTVCVMHAGDAYNVIPDNVEFGGTLRCTDEKDRQFIKQYMRHTAEQFAALHDVKIDLDFNQGVPAVRNDEQLINNIELTATEQFGEKAIFQIPVPSMGSEDFANYLDYLPGALVRVGTSSGKRTSHPLHDASFDIDESSLAPAVQLMSGVLLNHHRNVNLSK